MLVIIFLLPTKCLRNPELDPVVLRLVTPKSLQHHTHRIWAVFEQIPTEFRSTEQWGVFLIDKETFPLKMALGFLIHAQV